MRRNVSGEEAGIYDTTPGKSAAERLRSSRLTGPVPTPSYGDE
jgi:hypothetical protein